MMIESLDNDAVHKYGHHFANRWLRILEADKFIDGTHARLPQIKSRIQANAYMSLVKEAKFDPGYASVVVFG